MKNWHIVVLLILATIALRGAAFLLYPVPDPIIQDEFANMLGAQTFALGRLANPPLQFQDAFMEMHTLGDPTRIMKYPPAMAGFMALGIVLFGSAYAGVVLCMALLTGASYWCLSAWVRRRTAIIATVLLMLLFRAPHYWMQSYWGGGPIMLGCLLMLGAYARAVVQGQYRYIAVGLLGIILTLLTRPYEGGLLILGLCIGALCMPNRVPLLRAALLPSLVLMGCFVSFQLYYNKQTTGDPLTMPYMLYSERHIISPLFIFEQPLFENRSSQYVMRAMQDWEVDALYRMKVKGGLPLHFMSWAQLMQLDQLEKLPAILGFLVLLTAVLVLPASMAGEDFKKRRVDYYALHAGWMLLFMGALAETATNPHYLAPQMAVCMILWCRYAEELFARRKVVCLSMLALIVGLHMLNEKVMFGLNSTSPLFRASVIRQMDAAEGKDLAFVDMHEFIKHEPPHQGWVYNEPDIDSAEIIWAWYLTPGENKKLIAHYPGRKIWYINPYNRTFIPYADHRPPADHLP